MIRVRTPSRLHFGLLSLPAGEGLSWPNLDGDAVVPARRFGGAGLMVEAPGVRLGAAPAAAWAAEGPLAERALAFARRVAQTLPPDAARPLRLHVEHAAPEHRGLGTGTQLGLAVARAVTGACGLPGLDAANLARRAGRGARSALGVHGFARGGFLVEAGKRDPNALSPLALRLPFPERWRVVLALPPCPPGVSGPEEGLAFDRLLTQPLPAGAAEALCRLVLLGMVPALVEEDLEAFGEALYDFNARVGEAFAAVQGGRYAGPAVAELVAFVRRQGVRGVGQSSWGPAVFAVTEDEARADGLARRVGERFALGPEQMFVTGACNRGAVVEDST